MPSAKIPYPLIGRSFLHALGTVAYVLLVATLMTNGERLFGEPDGIIGPAAFLLLFVVSVAITGLLVVVTPVRWYLDGRKSEAMQLLGCIVGWLAVFAIFGLLQLALR